MQRQVRELMDRLGVRLDPDRPVRGLSIADQQIVEIAKALSFDARVLIMDEPTAALSGPEVERLFAVVRTLREHGVGVLYISHRLDEVFAMCRPVTVMRDGAVVHDARIADMTPDEMMRRMVGRELEHALPQADAEVGEPVLQVEGLTREGVFFDVGFTVRAGEIVALAGLVGAGRSEVARAIFGVDRPDAGRVQVSRPRAAAPAKPAAAMRAGVAFVPEDRRQQGLVPRPLDRAQHRAHAAALARPARVDPAPRRRPRWRASGARGCSSSSIASPTRSGRCRAATSRRSCWRKWLATEPKLLIIDEPTRGIDVGAKAEIYHLMSELAARGPRRADDLQRAAGGARHGRPRARHARGTADGRALARGGRRGAGRAARDGAVPPGRRLMATATAPPPQEGAQARRLTEFVLRVRELGIVVALAALILVTAILEPRFVEADSLRNLAVNASIFAILAVGQTLVIVTRNVDLSVGSVVGLTAFMAGDLLSSNQSLPLPVVFVLGMALGAACGLLNGVLVTFGQVPALVVTLGTLYAFRGLAFLWTDGRQVNAETLPDSFLSIGSDSVAGVPILVLIALVASCSLSASGCATSAPAASCTPSAPTPRAPGSPACARTAACSPPSCWPARWPAWAASSSPRGSAPSTRRRARATSSP